MPRIRTIKPEFWEDERIGALSIGARLLYLGLISLADDEGRFRASIPLLKAQVFPYDGKVDVFGWLAELARSGRVVLYGNDGESFGTIPKFRKHQKIDRPSDSRLPGHEDSTSIRRAFDDDSTTDQEGNGLDQEGNGSGSHTAPPAPAAVLGSPEDLDLFEHWKRVTDHPRAAWNKDRLEQIRSALKLGYKHADLKLAVDGCKATPFNQGQNDRSKRYDDLELILRDAKHVDDFMKQAERGDPIVRPKNGAWSAESQNVNRPPPGEVDMKTWGMQR